MEAYLLEKPKRPLSSRLNQMLDTVPLHENLVSSVNAGRIFATPGYTTGLSVKKDFLFKEARELANARPPPVIASYDEVEEKDEKAEKEKTAANDSVARKNRIRRRSIQMPKGKDGAGPSGDALMDKFNEKVLEAETSRVETGSKAEGAGSGEGAGGEEGGGEGGKKGGAWKKLGGRGSVAGGPGRKKAGRKQSIYAGSVYAASVYGGDDSEEGDGKKKNVRRGSIMGRGHYDMGGDEVVEKKEGMEVSCQFDYRFFTLDNMLDAGKPVLLKAAARRGPIWTLFETYSRDIEMKNEHDDPESLKVMGRSEMRDMCEDMEIIPEVRRTDVVIACNATVAHGGAGGNARAEDMNFKQFVECLCRVALLLYAHPPAVSSGRHPTTWREKVLKMTQRLGADNSNTSRLRSKLAGLQRMAKERRTRAVDRKWEYVGSQEAPASVIREVEGDVPSDIVDVMMRNEEELDDEPEWYQFGRSAINCGTVEIWPKHVTKRRYRVVLRNRGDRQARFTVRTEGLPMVTMSYSERPLAPGIPRVLDLTALFHEEGEWLGSVQVDWEGSDQVVSIPMVASCMFTDSHAGVPPYMIHESQIDLDDYLTPE